MFTFQHFFDRFLADIKSNIPVKKALNIALENVEKLNSDLGLSRRQVSRDDFKIEHFEFIAADLFPKDHNFEQIKANERALAFYIIGQIIAPVIMKKQYDFSQVFFTSLRKEVSYTLFAQYAFYYLKKHFKEILTLFKHKHQSQRIFRQFLIFTGVYELIKLSETAKKYDWFFDHDEEDLAAYANLTPKQIFLVALTFDALAREDSIYSMNELFLRSSKETADSLFNLAFIQDTFYTLRAAMEGPEMIEIIGNLDLFNDVEIILENYYSLYFSLRKSEFWTNKLPMPFSKHVDELDNGSPFFRGLNTYGNFSATTYELTKQNTEELLKGFYSTFKSGHIEKDGFFFTGSILNFVEDNQQRFWRVFDLLDRDNMSNNFGVLDMLDFMGVGADGYLGVKLLENAPVIDKRAIRLYKQRWRKLTPILDNPQNVQEILTLFETLLTCQRYKVLFTVNSQAQLRTMLNQNTSKSEKGILLCALSLSKYLEDKQLLSCFDYVLALAKKDKPITAKNILFEMAGEDLHPLLSDPYHAYEAVTREQASIEGNYSKSRENLVECFLVDLNTGRFVKPYIQIPKALEKALFTLKENYPNFKDVVDFYVSQFRLGNVTQHIKPVLLLGEAGVGKTQFINEFAKVLNTHTEFLDCPLITGSHVLSGIDSSYKSASAGRIYQAITDAENANPIIVFDEFDKFTSDEVKNVSYSLLEPQTSNRFKDDFLNYSIDASKAMYIATCNDLSELSKSLLTRFVIFKIERPSKENIYKIIDNMWKKVYRQCNKLPETLSDDIKQEIVNNNLRDISTFVQKIANHIILTERDVTVEDVYNIVQEQRKINIEIGEDFFSIVDPKSVEITLDDIRGAQEPKRQLKEFFDLFINPLTNNIGVKKPKGLILYGEPGTGKTMLFKALANYVNMPFIMLNGTSFSDKWYGESARKVRSLFEKARSYSPCVIYIDEFDAIGSRSNKQNSGDDIINELLTQMDGMNNLKDVLVVASTNYLERIDPALLRPGRFDKQIKVSLPTLEERKDIIEYYLSKHLCKDIDVERLAKLTSGQSPAEISNLFNQAGIIALREGRDHIIFNDFDEADEEILLGIRTAKENEQAKLETAYHEVGHAIVGMAMLPKHKVRKITVVPRSQSLGVAISYPEEETFTRTEEEMYGALCRVLGGIAADELFTKNSNSGGASDIKQATSLAKRMIMDYGFGRHYSNALSLLSYSDMLKDNLLSREQLDEINENMSQLVSKAFEKAKAILTEYEPLVHTLSKQLAEEEVLTEETLHAMFNDVKKLN